MTHEEFNNKVIDHLLGKNFYIADPVSGEQANDIIYEYVIKNYPKYDKSPIEKYRLKHKKCKWCKYWKYNVPKVPCGVPDYITCELKDKIIHGNWRAKFCKWYELKDVDNE